MIPDDIFVRRLKPSGVPKKYRALRLSDWKPYNQGAEQALHAAEAFVEHFYPRHYTSEPVTADIAYLGRGIALIGPPGAGKTALAALTVMEAARQHNVVFAFTSMADYIALLLEQISLSPMLNAGDARAVDRYWKIDEIKRRIYRSPLLGLDDVGKEHHTSSDFARDEVDKLLRARFSRGLPTVTTSNIPLPKWGDTYNPSMASFVNEAFAEVHIGGKDLRRGA